MAQAGIPVFAWKGETEAEYWECIEKRSLVRMVGHQTSCWMMEI